MNKPEVITKDFITLAKNKKTIKSYEDLKSILANNILVGFQYDLPKEFDLVSLPELAHRHRFMKNFSKTHSFEKEITNLKAVLTDYFNFKPDFEEENVKTVTEEKTSAEKEFKKSEIDEIGIIEKSKIDQENETIPEDSISVLESETLKLDSSSNLEEKEITNNQLQENFDNNLIASEHPNIEIEKTEVPEKVSSKANELLEKNITNKIDLTEEIVSNQSSTETKPSASTYDFINSISLEKTERKTDTENSLTDSEDNILNETLQLLGIGSIKMNLERKIINKKKKETYLSLEEWVKENHLWVEYLFKKLSRIQTLNLADEIRFMNIVRKYKFSPRFEHEINNLYENLKLN